MQSPITTFDQLLTAARSGTCRVACIYPHDAGTLEALARFEAAGLGSVVHIEGADPAEAAARAVALVREGRADILMKGLVGTDVLLRAVLDKACGLLPAGNVLTHLALCETPADRRLVVFTDVAVIPFPTHEQREAQIASAATLCRRLGIARPRVGLVHCSEKTSDKFPVTRSYERLRCCTDELIVDGPLDLLCCLSEEALRVKGLESPTGGKSDIVVFPDIEAGNTFYKSLHLLRPDLHSAAILAGTSAPVVLPSRGDTAETKLLSLALAKMSLPASRMTEAHAAGA